MMVKLYAEIYFQVKQNNETLMLSQNEAIPNLLWPKLLNQALQQVQDPEQSKVTTRIRISKRLVVL